VSFHETYERHHASLFRYLHRYTGDGDLADDLAQEAFVRLLRSEVPESEARPWLFRVATNLARDNGRRAKRGARLLAGEAERHDVAAGPEENLAHARRVERVREALAALDERERRMLLMREEGFAYREIADAVGVAPGSVGTLLARALARFRSAYVEG
jgi:RNA polymerase sigma-70 factor (ECF subfamily)